ncbi:MAG: phosphoribosylamine--glycine ligase [Saprospiraceae bacterium]|nr:phosphoribosylamine--glycine ligase [Saprospiraceae bacterium]
MKKNVLVLGSGGREHALAHQLAQSPLLGQLFVMPGNPGTGSLALNLAGSPESASDVIRAVEQFDIGVVVCGPEAPLAAGVMDALAEAPFDLPPICIGPGARGARLESSKAFAKEFMERHGIPTAAYRSFSKDQLEEALQYVEQRHPPIVLKASGLAAGKGVVICQDHPSAAQELMAMFAGKFGAASDTVVVEDFLEGVELSVFILTDGRDYVLLPEARDYKRVGEGDTGPNTGGMGAISPVPYATPEMLQRIRAEVIEPTLEGLRRDGIDYRGFIFFGLMLCSHGPYVIEYNCRLGDPETEVVLPRMQSDLLSCFIALGEGRLREVQAVTDPRAAATVVLVSGGYPGDFERGLEIGLPEQVPSGSMIFHSGTRLEYGTLLTSGGRVLALTSLASDAAGALEASLALAESVEFSGKTYRRDIGRDLLSGSASASDPS